MLGFLSYWALWFGLGALADLLGVNLTPYDIMLELASGLLLGAAMVATYQWFTTAVAAVKEAKEGYDFLNLSIFLTMFGLVYQRIWASGNRWLAEPTWMQQSPIGIPLILWTLFFGALFLLAAPETTRGIIPFRNWLGVITGVAIGCVLAGITIGFFLGQATPQF